MENKTHPDEIYLFAFLGGIQRKLKPLLLLTLFSGRVRQSEWDLFSKRKWKLFAAERNSRKMKLKQYPLTKRKLMERTFAQWRAAATVFQLPLQLDDRNTAMRLLSAREPILIGSVWLKVESCDWSFPFNTGNQLFGQNSLGRSIQADEDLDHGGPIQTEKLKAAIIWAERQAADPELPEAAKFNYDAD